jgi:hypothetical protein
VFRFELRNEKQTPVIVGQYIAYPLIKGYTYWYAPYGPVFNSETSPEAIERFLAGVKEAAKKHHAIFVRSELPEKYNYKETVPFVSKSSYTQERCEWVVDARQTIEDILKNMEQKTSIATLNTDNGLLGVEFTWAPTAAVGTDLNIELVKPTLAAGHHANTRNPNKRT